MPKYHSLREVQGDIHAGKITCRELVNYYLQRIETTADLNVYIEVFGEEALERADYLDRKFKANPDAMGKLFGMVVSLKDVICYEGHEVTAASKILEGFKSMYSATAVERLLAADAVIIGRVNCDQFAMGSTNENSVYGPVKNAADPERIPGGSSGGSAVSVQTDTCLASLGSDTGGSVRQPASFCGVVGFKPTYGRISRYGLLAYASSFDQIGTLTKSVEDAALITEVIAGADEFDSTALSDKAGIYSGNLQFSGKAKIAYFESAFEHESIEPSVREQANKTLEVLRGTGHHVEAVEFDCLDYIIPAYYVLTTAEASSNLSRYDGIRYGYRSPDAANLQETYKKSRTEGFSMEVKRRIMLGTFVLSSGYYDAYYTKAQKIRRLIYNKTQAIFKEFDFIVMPASPVAPWKIGEKSSDPVAMYLADIFTVQANMAGLPAICLPAGELENGMPFGIQFMANKYEEQKLLAFSHVFGNSLIR